MKRNLILLLILFCSLHATAQNRVIEMSAKRKGDDIQVTLRKEKPGTYTVMIYFEGLRNAGINNPYTIKLTNLVTNFDIRTMDSNQPVSYSSSRYWVQQGDVNPKKVDKDFIYRLPVSAGREVAVRKHLQLQRKVFWGRVAWL